MDRRIYTLIQWTWGLPQTLAGAGLYIAHRKDRHFDYNGARATAWDRDTGISLGKFIFVPESKDVSISSGDKEMARDDSRDGFLLRHEYGHTLQSLMLGPFYLLLVGLPSMMWNRLPYFRRKRRETGRSYYSAVFERTANELGKISSSDIFS